MVDSVCTLRTQHQDGWFPHLLVHILHSSGVLVNNKSDYSAATRLELHVSGSTEFRSDNIFQVRVIILV
jgi:hypothetical protein